MIIEWNGKEFVSVSMFGILNIYSVCRRNNGITGDIDGYCVHISNQLNSVITHTPTRIKYQ